MSSTNKRVKLTRIGNEMDVEHPNIPIGNVIVGLCGVIEVGLPFYLVKDDGTYRRTSRVMEIIDETTFKTNNSTYKIEELPEEKGLQYYSESYVPEYLFPVEITEENEAQIEEDLLFKLRESAFHMSDEEVRGMLDEFFMFHPEALVFRRRSFYYERV